MTVRILLWLSVILLACQGPAPDPFKDDGPTGGDVLILADEDFRSILEEERTVFEHVYPNAHIRFRFLPQKDLQQALMNDSVRVVFTTCAPGGEQQAYFRTRNLSTTMVPVLVDGIAVFKAPGMACADISVQEVVSRASDSSGSGLRFDGMGTGVVRSLVDSLFAGDASKLKNVAALAGTDSLLASIARDPEAIGMISFARISDLDDPQCRALRERMGLCAVSAQQGDSALIPSQSTLADGSYPLRRKLYALAMEGKSGLGTGFVSFVAGHKGQRIILKSGLAPQQVPARDVMIINQ